jgi:hypothetical protein
MRRLLYAAFVAVLVLTLWSIKPAGAEHDMVYAPCDPEDTRPLDEQVWYIDYQSGDTLRFDDPWWGERPGFGRYTNWRHQCRLGMTGVWQAAPILPLPHPPTHTVESRDAITTTTTTTTISPAPSTTQPPPTTTEGISAPSDQPETTVPATTTTHPLPPADALDGYDLFDAEWDGYPFEQTILLLEERYPPGTPDRFHFRLSVAVEFLRQGGMVKGLDNLWESG